MLKSLLSVLLFSFASAEGTTEEGLKFLEENKKKPGVITLSSGLQYKVLRAGDGPEHPHPNTPCDVHYKGTLIDGTKFDSSYDRGEPTTFAPNQVIKGWTEAMQLMVEGDKWEMYIPSELAYGDSGSPPTIPGGAVLVFTMEILELKEDGKAALRCDVNSLKMCTDKEKTFVKKWKTESTETQNKELERLQKLRGGKIKPGKIEWFDRRIDCLKKLSGETEEKKLEDL